MNVHTFAIQKGGVGKTTVLVGLAEALLQEGYSVLVIDLDAQCNASQWLTQTGRKEYRDQVGNTIGHALDAEIGGGPSLSMQDMIRETPVGAGLVPANPYMNPLLEESPRTFLRRRLQSYRQAAESGESASYDVTLVDTPPYIGPAVWAALTASDGVVIPVQLEGLSIEGLNSFLEAIHTARDQGNAALSVTGIFANQVDVRRSTAESGWELLQEQYGDAVFESRLRHRAAVADASTAKAPLLQSGGPHVRDAFGALAEEFISRI